MGSGDFFAGPVLMCIIIHRFASDCNLFSKKNRFSAFYPYLCGVYLSVFVDFDGKSGASDVVRVDRGAA